MFLESPCLTNTCLFKTICVPSQHIDKRSISATKEETHVIHLSNTIKDDIIREANIKVTASHIDPGLRPFDWYKALVAAGARRHGFPQPYRDAIESVSAQPDSDDARATQNAALIDRD